MQPSEPARSDASSDELKKPSSVVGSPQRELRLSHGDLWAASLGYAARGRFHCDVAFTTSPRSIPLRRFLPSGTGRFP